MMRDQLEVLAESMRQHRAAVRQNEADRQMRERQLSYAQAMQSVCATMASGAMIGAVLIADPKAAAQSFADSTKWQVAGILASLGKPELVTQFLNSLAIDKAGG